MTFLLDEWGARFILRLVRFSWLSDPGIGIDVIGVPSRPGGLLAHHVFPGGPWQDEGHPAPIAVPEVP